MRAAAELIVLGLIGGVTLAGCGQAADNGAAARDAQPTEIEALPVDESDGTPTNELMNGYQADEAADNAVNEFQGDGPAD